MSPTSLQLQNSKAVIQSKDTSIQELKEKMAFLEAEVRALGSPREGEGLGSGVLSSCCSEASIWDGRFR